MVEIAAVTSPLPPPASNTCLQWAGSHRWTMVLAVMIGFVIPQSMFWWTQRYIDDIRPIPPTIERVIVAPRDVFGSVKVTVKFLTAPTKHCLRIGGHMMLRIPVNVVDPEFDLMGGSLAGEGFPTLTTGRSTVTYHFASTIVAGTYRYSYRRFMQCDPYKLIPFQDEVTTEIIVP